MKSAEEGDRRRPQPFHWLSFGIGVLVGGCAVFVAVGFIIVKSILSVPFMLERGEPISTELDVHVELSVASDGCTVTRSEVRGPSGIRGLTWVVVDPSGDRVLAGNAMDEYEYRYYRPGEFSVHLETWYEGRYVPISDEVLIHCP